MDISGWVGIAKHLGLYDRCESSVHVHAPAERADLFHSADCGSTEFEYLNLLHAIVLASKPALVLETGTYFGYGTLAIASALKSNGTGTMITLDVDACEKARVLVNDAGLASVVEFQKRDAVEFCRTYSGNAFDFMFHDSGGERAYEHQLLKESKKIMPGALVCFHDASPFRVGPSPNSWIDGLNGAPNMIWFNLSRGLRLLQCL